ETPLTYRLRETRLAQVPVTRSDARSNEGMDYYDGEVLEQLQLELFSRAALAHICKELAIQAHLLTHSMAMAIADRLGEDAALTNAEFQMQGSAWPISERLCRSLGLSGGGLDAIVCVLSVHPWLCPEEYLACRIDRAEDESVLLAFDAGPAASEESPYGLYQLLASGRDAGLEALVRGIDPRAVVIPVEGQAMAWRITLEEGAELRDEPLSVQIAKGTLAYSTQFHDHIALLQG
ncbi:MAG: hypothetical protein ACPG1A_03875, partial [Halioglobus sp.]